MGGHGLLCAGQRVFYDCNPTIQGTTAWSISAEGKREFVVVWDLDKQIDVISRRGGMLPLLGRHTFVEPVIDTEGLYVLDPQGGAAVLAEARAAEGGFRVGVGRG